MSNSKNNFGVRQIIAIGMFCALAYVVMLLSKLIPINVAGFLTLDFKDVIIAICGFIFGPVSSVIVSVIVSLIEMITVSSTGPVGLLMNVLSTCAFVCPAAIIYGRRRKFIGAIIGLIAGALCMTAVMILWNWLITPLYMGVDRDVVVSMLVPVFLPFNLLKGGLNAAVTILLYKPIITALRRARLVKASTAPQGRKPRKGLTIAVTLISLFVIASLVMVILAWTHII